MSVYIKGFPLPNNCGACPLRLAWCRERIYMVTRPERCPLIEIPPHERLIDADALIHSYYHAPSFPNLCKAINDAPTIIPADKEGEG